MNQITIISVGGERSGLGRAALALRDYYTNNEAKSRFSTEVKLGVFGYSLRGFFESIHWIMRNKKYGGEILTVGILNPVVLFSRVKVTSVVFDIYCFREQGLKAKIQRLAHKYFLGRVDAVVPVSDWVKDEICRFIPEASVTRDSILNPNFFVDICRRDNAQAKHKPLICVVTSEKPNKNFSLLKKIIEQNERLMLFHFCVIGSVNLSGNHVDVLTNISGNFLIKIYEMCDALLIPSNAEGLSYPVVDCYVRSKYIVSLDIPGLHWLKGYNKWLVFRNVGDIVEAFRDPSLFSRD